MSRIFSPKKPKAILPPPPAEIEPVETVTETAEEAGRRRRKKLVTGGAPSTRISGIRSALTIALKKRLGE